jgi:hypothetical protein
LVRVAAVKESLADEMLEKVAAVKVSLAETAALDHDYVEDASLALQSYLDQQE